MSMNRKEKGAPERRARRRPARQARKAATVVEPGKFVSEGDVVYVLIETLLLTRMKTIIRPRKRKEHAA
jgi:hypothetical protein